MGYRYVKEPKPPVTVKVDETDWKPTEEDFERWGFYKNPQNTSGSILYILKVTGYTGELVLQIEYLSEWFVY